MKKFLIKLVNIDTARRKLILEKVREICKNVDYVV